MQLLSLLLICLGVSIHAYSIKYTAYTDNTCSSVDLSMTGPLLPAGSCVAEFRSKKYNTGKITFINEEYLTSCDYSDNACNVLTVCENYTNNACVASTSTSFSNKYSWVMADGAWAITYSSYFDTACNNMELAGRIFESVCSPENIQVVPQSGKITFINDEYLTSCDYADASCEQLTICENYTNSRCYGSSVTAFSNVYAWAPLNAPATEAPSTQSPSAPSTQAPSTPSTPSAPSTSDFTITYTAYQDNHCDQVDASTTGQIFAYTCAPEFRKVPQSGKVTYIDENLLTSCDYRDRTCGDLVLCENYTRDACYASSTVDFSNKYTWTLLENNEWTIQYTSYNTKTCSGSPTVTSNIRQQTCGEEYVEKPQSGKITSITDDWLISCDYSDINCEQLLVCENHTNSQCYGSQVTSFSNKYSWKRTTTSPSTPTSSPSAAPADPTPTGSGESDVSFRIGYIGFNDNTCGDVDEAASGEIFAYKCVPEYRNAPQAGKVVFINMDYLISCDYTDLECKNLELCENYTNHQCYDSSSYSFSNKYSWTENPNGGFSITYASFSEKGCAAEKTAVSGEILEGQCSVESRKKPQSGMITYIDDTSLVSCDYSDLDCKDLILCETFNNAQCYASSVTSFSDMYVWQRASSASSVVASFALFFVAMAVALF